MDGDDEPIKGAGFTVNDGSTMGRTDAAGIAYLSRLPTDQHVDIALDGDTLEDPQWVPRLAGVRVVPRPGTVTQIEFPVIVTGEIDGTTYRIGADGTRLAASAMQLELVDSGGKVAMRGTSGGDGYFVLSNVVPGDYQLRVSPEQLKQLHMHAAGGQKLTVTADGSFVNGRELIVEYDVPR
jgi:outer membrane usher protein FimD/PapC